MKIPRLAIAMGYIDDDLISAAEVYKPHHKKWYQLNWLKYGAVAACICIVALITIPLLSEQVTSPTNDTESQKVLTLAEAQAYEPFGEYFPSIVADGYYLEDEVRIYDQTVMQAIFVNDENGDALVVRIAPKTRYSNVETGKVFYKNKGDSKSSYLYVDCGDYIVYYSSAKCDLNEVQGFDKMVTSARYFTD